MSLSHNLETLYRPGESAPVSGIYRVLHVGHRENHEVVILRGESFPNCRSCKGKVVFQLVDAINHVAHDWDFTGPNLELIYSRDRDPGTKAG